MGIAASLLIFAAAASQAAGQPASDVRASKQPVAVQAQATARILAGAEVRLSRDNQQAEVTSEAPRQITRDTAGTQWIEFS